MPEPYDELLATTVEFQIVRLSILEVPPFPYPVPIPEPYDELLARTVDSPIDRL
jgi:hypothetical protein